MLKVFHISKCIREMKPFDIDLSISNGYKDYLYRFSIHFIDTEGDAEDVNKASFLRKKVKKKILQTPPAMTTFSAIVY